jgi:hypothetical protein
MRSSNTVRSTYLLGGDLRRTGMTELELAKIEAKAVVGEAGDALGNAERALFVLQRDADIKTAIDALEWVKVQSERATANAACILRRLKGMTPNAALTGERTGEL